ncbi:putative tyrosine phospatase-like protein [Trypanosoma cruzi]|uniref:Putative tyrosine phospatase-like protein n=1 Tax=Trypanosoma cruzi TaxID=5693 RepID=A0A2V2WW35_TRYCR|nr:putative tyrosine phospatase-like protein [Trypanosoma cruzi]
MLCRCGEILRCGIFMQSATRAKCSFLPTEMSEVLQLLINVERHPIYVHCLDGRHIVGLVIMGLRKLQFWEVNCSHLEYQRFTRSVQTRWHLSLIIVDLLPCPCASHPGFGRAPGLTLWGSPDASMWAFVSNFHPYHVIWKALRVRVRSIVGTRRCKQHFHKPQHQESYAGASHLTYAGGRGLNIAAAYGNCDT